MSSLTNTSINRGASRFSNNVLLSGDGSYANLKRSQDIVRSTNTLGSRDNNNPPPDSYVPTPDAILSNAFLSALFNKVDDGVLNEMESMLKNIALNQTFSDKDQSLLIGVTNSEVLAQSSTASTNFSNVLSEIAAEATESLIGSILDGLKVLIDLVSTIGEAVTLNIPAVVGQAVNLSNDATQFGCQIAVATGDTNKNVEEGAEGGWVAMIPSKAAQEVLDDTLNAVCLIGLNSIAKGATKDIGKIIEKYGVKNCKLALAKFGFIATEAGTSLAGFIANIVEQSEGKSSDMGNVAIFLNSGVSFILTEIVNSIMVSQMEKHGDSKDRIELTKDIVDGVLSAAGYAFSRWAAGKFAKQNETTATVNSALKPVVVEDGFAKRPGISNYAEEEGDEMIEMDSLSSTTAPTATTPAASPTPVPNVQAAANLAKLKLGADGLMRLGATMAINAALERIYTGGATVTTAILQKRATDDQNVSIRNQNVLEIAIQGSKELFESDASQQKLMYQIIKTLKTVQSELIKTSLNYNKAREQNS